MPRNDICSIEGCKRWITSRRLEMGATICSYHEKKSIDKQNKKFKAEPLKNKIKHETYNKLLMIRSGIFSYNDVKSAIVWLEEQLKDVNFQKYYKDETGDIFWNTKLTFERLIHKAFEDVFEDENM